MITKETECCFLSYLSLLTLILTSRQRREWWQILTPQGEKNCVGCLMVRRLLVCLIPTVCNQQQQNLNDCVKWLISCLRSAFIHPSRLEQLIITMLFFFFLHHLFFSCAFLTQKYLAVILSDSWWIPGASFVKWPVFFFPPQVGAPVKYAWRRNEWSRLLRKCWCFMRNFCDCDLQVCFIFALMLHLLRFRAASRWETLFLFLFFCTKWKQLCRSGRLVCSQLTVIKCTSFN